MGYTHYFSRTVSLSEEQAAQLCENAAKIVTYWFDHTRNSAEIFARKEKHSGSWDEFLDSSHNQLKILFSVDNREEKLVYGKNPTRFVFILTTKLFLRRISTFRLTGIVSLSVKRIMQ